MFRRLAIALGLCLLSSGVWAQGNPQCPTRNLGDSTNACASTKFVQNQFATPTLPLPNTQIYVGNVSGVAVAVAMSGDCTIANTGAITCSKLSGSVVNGAVKLNGSGVVSQAACADLSNGATGCSTAVGTAATANTGTSGHNLPFLDGNNTWSGSNNFTGGATVNSTPISVTIASSPIALGTSAISSATCAAAVSASALGVTTSDVIIANFSADPTSTTGYIPATTGMLAIIVYPTANNVNFKVCNNTAASITPGAVTINWRVVR